RRQIGSSWLTSSVDIMCTYTTLIRSNEKYIATEKGRAKSANVTVMAKMADGNIRNMGVMPFQLREVPKPKLMFGSLEPGTYSARSEEHTSELKSRENHVCRLLRDKH